MPAQNCIRCFQPLNGNDVCPHCGCVNSAYQPKASYLPVGSLLQRRYTVGLVLGEGGFGITYAGFDTQLNRRVAVKEYFPAGCVLRDAAKSLQVTCSDTEDLRERFEIGRQKALQEARSLAQLDDIGDIVRVLDFFAENGTAYIIMEFVEGATLREYVQQRGGALPCEEAVELLTPVMRALQDIHTRGFVHRDISPDNIMVTSRGNLKLLDFGAVKQLADEGGEYTQNVIIKRGFSPLELYSTTELIGPWSDVYSMCATIFFAVCGKKPPDPIDRLKYDTAPDTLRSRVSPPFADVLLKGLALQETARYRTMGELIYGLSAAKNAAASLRAAQANPDATMLADVPRAPARLPEEAKPLRTDINSQPTVYGKAPQENRGTNIARENGGEAYGYTPPETKAHPGKRKLNPIVPLAVICAAALIVLTVLLLPRILRSGDETATGSTEAPRTEADGTADAVSTETQTGSASYLPGDYIVETGGFGLKFRKDPSKDSDVLEVLGEDTSLTITEIYFDESNAETDPDYAYWGKCTFNGYTGWVVMAYLGPAQSSETMQSSETEQDGPLTKLPVPKTEDMPSGDRWSLVLLNIYHKISDSYEPLLTKIDGTVDVYLHEDVAEHYVEMARAAARDGITLNVEYGFITPERQERMFQEEVETYTAQGFSKDEAELKASFTVLPARCSEANIGLSVDFAHNDGDFSASETYAWLCAHAAEYGFIERYREGKEDITHFNACPWHWRYVGTDASGFMQTYNFTLEEYMGEID